MFGVVKIMNEEKARKELRRIINTGLSNCKIEKTNRDWCVKLVGFVTGSTIKKILDGGFNIFFSSENELIVEFA